MQLSHLVIFSLFSLGLSTPLQNREEQTDGFSTGPDGLPYLLGGHAHPSHSTRASSSISKRTAAQIEADIATVSTDLTSFDNSIKKFTGTLLQALALLSAYQTVSSSVETATAEITSTGALSAADSAAIYADVDSLTAQITTTLGDADDKYSVVKSAGYASYVCEALSSLKTDADGFYTALEGTIDSTYTSGLETLQSTADSSFASTISTYGC